MKLTETYWDQRYNEQSVPWDLGSVSPPIKAYVDQLQDKAAKILIPGAGNAHEAEYLFQQGFTNVHVVDLSLTALNNFKKRVPEFPRDQLIHNNFFEIDESFDVMIEQTFFCALEPSLRLDYVKQVRKLLLDDGLLVGLLFNFPLTEDGPPFGGDQEHYKHLFSNSFEIKHMEPCYNSHVSRAGKELFIEMIPKK